MSERIKLPRLVNDFPRRSRIECLTPAEQAIRSAMLSVEEVGADALLTDAVLLLEKAKDRVADFLEGMSQRTDWLPIAIAPEGVYVLAFGEYYGRRPMLAMKTGGVWYEGNKPIEPTHWMEIPPLPVGREP